MAEESESLKAPVVVTAETRKLHDDFVAEIHKREISSSENFDKSILTFSSAGLALSIGFLNDFMPIQWATASWTLYVSWALFTVATCATMASFLVSARALADQKNIAHAYYIESDTDAFNRPNPWNAWTLRLNYTSGGAFLAAMVLSVVFISINLEKGSILKNQNLQKSGSASGLSTTQGDQSNMVHKGLTVPTMQPTQRPTTSSSGAAGSSTQAAASQAASTPKAK